MKAGLPIEAVLLFLFFQIPFPHFITLAKTNAKNHIEMTDKTLQTQNKELVINFLKAIENRVNTAELSVYYHDEVEQTEYPNALVKNTVLRDKAALLEAAERGKNVITKETYEIVSLNAVDNTVMLECIWKGTLAIPLGQLKAGEQLIAHFAQFYTLKDGKIFRQKNYDCFEPFQ